MREHYSKQCHLAMLRSIATYVTDGRTYGDPPTSPHILTFRNARARIRAIRIEESAG